MTAPVTKFPSSVESSGDGLSRFWWVSCVILVSVISVCCVAAMIHAAKKTSRSFYVAQGGTARIKGASSEANPYIGESTFKAEAWLEGWMYAYDEDAPDPNRR